MFVINSSIARRKFNKTKASTSNERNSIGIGYVGLVQAAVLSVVGHHVCCVDNNAKEGANIGDILFMAEALNVDFSRDCEAQQLKLDDAWIYYVD